MDLRCENGIKFGDLSLDDRILSVKCRSRRCGHRPGVVVLHRFSVNTGELLNTRLLKDPAWKEGGRRAASRNPALRTA